MRYVKNSTVMAAAVLVVVTCYVFSQETAASATTDGAVASGSAKLSADRSVISGIPTIVRTATTQLWISPLVATSGRFASSPYSMNAGYCDFSVRTA